MKAPKAFWRTFRDQLGMVAAVYGSLPIGMARTSEQRPPNFDMDIQQIHLPRSTSEALQRDMAAVGGDLYRALERSCERQK